VRILSNIKESIEGVLKNHLFDFIDEETKKSIADQLDITKHAVSFSYNDSYDSCYCTLNLGDSGVWVADVSNEEIKVKEVFV
jgi:hypothetical protein